MKFLNLLIVLSVIYLTVQPAFAYLDPGTGSMVVQILIACFATIAIFFKSIWAGIKSLFIKGTPKSSDEDD